MTDTNISTPYDFSKSTEENHSLKEGTVKFVGKYAEIRELLDYSYHSHYSEDRQLFHDELIEQFLETIVEDGDLTCEKPLEPWLVFTAGCMGAGKGFTMKWLDDLGLFPLKAFVKVDADSLREMLPETKKYIELNPSTAGFHTQKEVGYIAEVRM